MSIRANSEISTVYFPYYLAVFKNGDRHVCEAYRIDNGAPIPRLSEMFTSSDYDSPRELILGLCYRNEEVMTVTAPHVKDSLVISHNGVCNNKEGFFKRSDGNYRWVVTDRQIGMILGVFKADSFAKGACNRIANDDVLCLNSFDAGKLVFVEKTPEQRELILSCISLERDERIRLYNEYMTAREV